MSMRTRMSGYEYEDSYPYPYSTRYVSLSCIIVTSSDSSNNNKHLQYFNIARTYPPNQPASQPAVRTDGRMENRPKCSMIHPSKSTTSPHLTSLLEQERIKKDVRGFRCRTKRTSIAGLLIRFDSSRDLKWVG